MSEPVYKLTIPYEFPTFNTEINYAKKHWSYYARHKDTWTYFVTAHINQKPHPIIDNYPYSLKLTIFDKTLKKDIDGMGSIAVKYILDGMVACHLIINDSLKYISSYSVVWGGVDKQNPRIEIELNK